MINEREKALPKFKRKRFAENATHYKRLLNIIAAALAAEKKTFILISSSIIV